MCLFSMTVYKFLNLMFLHDIIRLWNKKYKIHKNLRDDALVVKQAEKNMISM